MADSKYKQEVTWEQVQAAAKAFEGELPADCLNSYIDPPEDAAVAILEAAFPGLRISS